jgi:hypothetical protein
VIGIKYPVSKYYYSQSENSIYNKSILEIDSFVKKHIDIILDYKNLYLKNDIYFNNQDHLNKQGAITFTEFLKNELQTLNPNNN